jgi:hypothetical protein
MTLRHSGKGGQQRRQTTRERSPRTDIIGRAGCWTKGVHKSIIKKQPEPDNKKPGVRARTIFVPICIDKDRDKEGTSTMNERQVLATTPSRAKKEDSEEKTMGPHLERRSRRVSTYRDPSFLRFEPQWRCDPRLQQAIHE